MVVDLDHKKTRRDGRASESDDAFLTLLRLFAFLFGVANVRDNVKD